MNKTHDNESEESLNLNPMGSKETSKDPRNMGDNGNPAQSAGRVSAEEQNAHPASLAQPMKADAEQMADSIPSLWG